MTTAIRDSYATLDSALIGRTGQGVYVGIDKTNLPHRADVIIPRDEFLAAVAAELGVIVIDRDDLPEVTPHPRLPKTFTVGGGEHTTHSAHDAKYARERGIGYLAIAEHLENHPPIDEAQVDALVEVCMAEGVADPHRTARRLVAAGVRAPQTGDDQ